MQPRARSTGRPTSSAGATLAVDFDAVRSQITHTHYGALKVKDAIVDQLRDATGERPTVDTARPSVRVNVRVVEDRAVFAIDLSGEALHRRGYRGAGVPAPLKENLAAALLLRAGWPEIAASGGGFLDPMCGSGTLPIEAAMIAGDIAPGIFRDYWGFTRLARPRSGAVVEAGHRGAGAHGARRPRGRTHRRHRPRLPRDPRRLRRARSHRTAQARARRASQPRRREAADADRPAARESAVRRATRRGDEGLRALYGELGRVLRERFVGWRAAVFTGNPGLPRELKLETKRAHRFMNGAIECRLLRFDVEPGSFVAERTPGRLHAVDPRSPNSRARRCSRTA
jgi:23S rRNA (guanine2445-N2)-methyltransferase / 23S rRNA (guanine2069-N7)-methyltransferase